MTLPTKRPTTPETKEFPIVVESALAMAGKSSPKKYINLLLYAGNKTGIKGRESFHKNRESRVITSVRCPVPTRLHEDPIFLHDRNPIPLQTYFMLEEADV